MATISSARESLKSLTSCSLSRRVQKEAASNTKPSQGRALIVTPPTMLSVWFRPHHWAPGRTGEHLPLRVHFDLKEALGLPEAVMTDNTLILHDPVRPGDRISNQQVLKSVSDPKTTKLGTGRFWVIDVEYHNQHGDLVGIESYTGFGYRRDGEGSAA